MAVLISGRQLSFTPTVDANLLLNFAVEEIYLVCSPDELALVELSPLEKTDTLVDFTMRERLYAGRDHPDIAGSLNNLGAAYAKTNEPEKLAGILRESETNAMRRLVVAAAFITLARTDAGRAATESALGKVVKSGPPMARQTARLVGGLIGAKADGLAFLQELVP